MRRLLLTVTVFLMLTASANAIPIKDVRTGRQFSCPDPSGVNQGPTTVIACTTYADPGSFALWRSNNAQRHWWHRIGSIFPRGHKPNWVKAGGWYWAPDLERFPDRWMVYFAADSKHHGFAVGVAWSKNLSGPWHSKLLHWRGQYNRSSAQKETYGGVIDPGESQNPVTKQRYLVWSEQPASMWIAPLTRDGWWIEGGQVYMAGAIQKPTDCSAKGCCTEGSALMFHQGKAYLLYSVRSTWDWSYAMRAAYAPATNPLRFFTRIPGYILRAGNGWFGPGGGQTPVQIGRNKWVEFYHAMTGPDPTHTSAVRMGMMSSFTWHGVRPVVGNGVAG